MTCQFYSITRKVMPGGTEIGSSPMPHAVDMPLCKLKRKPDLLFWGGKCDQTPHEGPCWFWIDEKGNQIDIQFNQASQSGG